MANKVELDKEGFIYQELKADMTPEDLAGDLPIILELEKKLTAESRPIKLLLNASSTVKASTELRKAGLSNMEKMHYHKLAVYGPNTYIKYLINFVLTAAGKGGKIKVFKSEEEARQWLKK